MAFSWEINVKGFGPFEASLSADLQLSKSKVAIYAGNGEGKTCLSRLFRAGEQDAPPLSDTIITRGVKSGAFSFETIDGNGVIQAGLTIKKRMGKKANVISTGDLLYHVFNSDYVEENLAKASFAPSASINGYILGKANIDVSAKKAQLATIDQQIKGIREEIEKAVANQQKILCDLGVRKNMKAFAAFNVENILNLTLSESEYNKVFQEYQALTSLPDDTGELNEPLAPKVTIDFSLLSEVLGTTYKRSDFSEEFISKVKQKQSFIEQGVELASGKKCPFCGQDLNDDAVELIQRYEDYLSEQEAQIHNRIADLMQSISNYENLYAVFYASYLELVINYQSLKSAFSKLRNEVLPVLPANDTVHDAAASMIETLKEKDQNIEKSCVVDSVITFQNLIRSIAGKVDDAARKIRALNVLIQQSSSEKTEARTRLCEESGKEIREKYNDEIIKFYQLQSQHLALNKEIADKESLVRRSKRDVVADLLSKLIHTVFGEKYIFDKTQFVIQFRNEKLGKDAERILSDGEKSVLAFCHYIASTPEQFTNEDDSAKLFFVIDDPISSMDFRYVYSVVQIIRDLGMIFKTQRIRLLIFTHNSAFYNMLARNKITTEHYILNAGQISECTDFGIVPYAEHLKDVNAVRCGESPKHTTGNSIRQIIEALWRFENPAATDLLDFINSDDCRELSSCEYIYTLCQDQSHGASVFDREQPIGDDAVRRACETLITYIHDKYPGQLIACDIDY